uniref:HTH CENPB-type domain-containing protein n=1 Tax=Steinernema glaseri TaxID=37863 RepID=A0A1I8AB46_9BILA
MSLNPNNVAKLLSFVYPLEGATSEFTNVEYEALNYIISYLQELGDNRESLEHDPELESIADSDDNLESSDENDDEDCDSGEEGPSSIASSSSRRSRSPLPRRKIHDLYPRATMSEIVNRYNKAKSPSLELRRITHDYKLVHGRIDIMRMGKHLQKSKRLLEKEIKDDLFVRFLHMRDLDYIISDNDLQTMALEIAKEKGLNDFQASKHFIVNFKQTRKIVSRKITRFTTSRPFSDVQDKQAEENRFKIRITTGLSNHPNLDKVFNSDQTGFTYEMFKGRTLERIGTHHVGGHVQSKSACSHSFTLQPVISATGKLQIPVLVCLQERKRVPKKFARQVSGYEYLKVVHSGSGKMDSNLITTWINDVFLPNGGEGSLLIIDAYPGYKRVMREVNNTTRLVEFEVIPEGATPRLQPLDVYYNRQLKVFYRRLTQIVVRERAPNSKFTVEKMFCPW